MPTILEKIAEIEAEVCDLVEKSVIEMNTVMYDRWLVLKETKLQPTILGY